MLEIVQLHFLNEHNKHNIKTCHILEKLLKLFQESGHVDIVSFLFIKG